MYYDRPFENVHSINIYYPNQTREDLKDFLTLMLNPKESNRLLNYIIIGDSAYTQGNLVIINRPNEIVNIKNERSHFFIKKRVIDKNDYFEYSFKYDFDSGKYELKVRKNERGVISNVTNAFKVNEEIPKLLAEADTIDYYPDINIINDEQCIIKGRQGILEINDAEISLYSPKQKNNNPRILEMQRYTIIKNDTKEVVGHVTFDFRYTNISYRIYEQYQGHYYASKALKLMIELIKNNVNFERENLYVRIDKDNMASIKTAEACNLEKVDGLGSIQEYVVNPQKILTVR